MKKKIFVLSAVVVGALAMVLLVPAERTGADPCYKCLFGGTTDPAWGMGTTCSQATDDAIYNAYALIPTWCYECGTTVNSLEPCNTSCTNAAECYDAAKDMWRVDVSLTYKCSEYICI